MAWYSWFWLIWVLSFIGVEGYAVVSPKTGDTFTEHWRWLRDQLGYFAHLFVWGTAIGIVWLFAHFILEIV